MSRAIRVYLFLLMALVPIPGRAPAKDLPTQEAFDWELSDNPWAAYRSASAAFLAINAETSPIDKVRLTNFFLAAAATIEQLDLADKKIQEIEVAWIQASTLSLHRERVMLGYYLGMYYRLVGDIKRSDTFYLRAIAEARQHHEDDALIQILINYGLSLDVGDQKTQSLQYFQEANTMALDASRPISELHRQEALLIATLAVEESETGNMMVEIERGIQYFIESKRHHSLASFAFNYARSKISADVDKALFYYDIALNAARNIDDRSTVGAVLAEQADILNRRGQFAEGEKKAGEAARVIGDTDRHWQGRALAEQAFSLWKLHRLPEALVTINKAKDLVSKENLLRHLSIMKTRASIQEALNLHKDAIESHKVIEEIQNKRQIQMESEHFAQAKVKLGLQMEEQRNQLLQKENELQSARLKSSRYLRTAAIALAVLLIGAVFSTIWALFNARQVRRAKEKIQMILDVIEEGILTINHKLQADPQSSRYLAQLYPNLAEGKRDAVDELFPASAIGSESQSMIRETLRACLGEERLSWTLNAAHLPTEIVFPGSVPRTIHILWQPLMDKDERIHGFLLSLRDISEQKLLQNEVKMQHRVHEIFLTRMADAERLLTDLQKELQNADGKDDSFRRLLHTRKGEARTLGLKGLSQAIHQLESDLADETLWKLLREEVRLYAQLMQEASVPQVRSTTLIETVSSMIPAFRQQLQEAQITLATMEVSDAVMQWPEPILDAVRQNLLHALANSADHGYILPQKRGKKPAGAVFHVEAEQSTDGIVVRVRDFGAGLDFLRLGELAKAKGFIPGQEESVADVVFLDGATTAEQASVTSGRGVGLSAVRDVCRRFQGQAWLRPNDQGPGSLLIMTFNRRSASHDRSA